MSVADRLNKLSTDITSAYTSINSKGGTIPANKNTNNLPTAINSIEVIESATAEGENLSLANTKAMPYSDYVVEGKSEQEGEPSPSNPSEIHSVADDVNLFDKNGGNIADGYISASGYFAPEQGNVDEMVYIKCKPNTTYTLQKMVQNTIAKNRFVVGTSTVSPTGQINVNILYRANEGSTITSQTVTTDNNANYLLFFCYNTDSNTSFEEMLNSIKISEFPTVTPYSPYNQGTVTIKQRGKNLFDIEKWVLQGNNSNYYSYSNGILSINALDDRTFLNFSESEKIYLPNGSYYLSNIGNAEIRIYNQGSDYTTITNEFTVTLGYIYLKLVSSSAITCQPMIEQGSTATPYEPYQANDYTIQTAPLRSLPNGVKDTIEDDGIHRRVGRVVLNGSEDWIQGGTQYTGLYSAYVNKDDMKKQEGYSRDLLSNYFKENDFSTQEEGITKSSNPTSFALILIRLSNDNATNMTTFKNWLSNNPTEVLYELATEVIEPLTQNQATTMLDIIKTGSYEGTTNIYTDEDVKPTIGVGYYKKS